MKVHVLLYFGNSSEWKGRSPLIITKGKKDNIKCVLKTKKRIEENDYIEKRMERNQRGNFVRPSLKEIVN